MGVSSFLRIVCPACGQGTLSVQTGDEHDGNSYSANEELISDKLAERLKPNLGVHDCNHCNRSFNVDLMLPRVVYTLSVTEVT